jgi:hypothetical protein
MAIRLILPHAVYFFFPPTSVGIDEGSGPRHAIVGIPSESRRDDAKTERGGVVVAMGVDDGLVGIVDVGRGRRRPPSWAGAA